MLANKERRFSQNWQKIKTELQPSYILEKDKWTSVIVSGALVGLMTTILSISFAVLVFGKAIPEALNIGIGMALFSNVLLHLCSALGSSGEGVVSHVQSLPPPIQAAMLSSLMSMLPLSMSLDNRTTVAVFAILFSAIFTGGVLFLFGWLKLGRLVRFLPLPVVSGFLASVGFALVLGGIATMTSVSVTISSLPQFFSLALICKWLPGMMLAVVLWVITARIKHELTFPTILAIAVVLFYVVYFVLGMSPSDMMKGNLLLGPFPLNQLWTPSYTYINQIHTLDWSLIMRHIGLIATIPLVCFIGGLLMLSAIEFSTGIEGNPNFELKTLGVGNFISGILGGGFVGYPSTTFTIMQYKLGATTRLSGILSAIVPIVVLIIGTSFLGYIPRFAVGGLLIYFGYQFIDYWLIKLSSYSTKPDTAIIGAIVIASLWFGFVASIGVGIFAAAAFFLFKYSQTSVFRYVSTGASLRSRVSRNAMHEEWLSVNADRMSIFGLQGYIFFGTAHNLHEEIMNHVTNASQQPLDCVILDFRHVTGIDTSVVQSFHKLYLQLNRKDITLIFAQMPPKYQGLMQKIGLSKDGAIKGFAEFANIDEALEWREDYLLEHSNLPLYETQSLLAVCTAHFKDAAKAEILLQYLTRIELAPGTKIVQQNTVADNLFFLESGRLSTYKEIENRPPIRLQTMVDNTIVGEIGFYLGELRTATVIADKPSIVYCLTLDALAKMEREHPLVAIALHRLIVEKTATRVNHVFKSVKAFM